MRRVELVEAAFADQRRVLGAGFGVNEIAEKDEPCVSAYEIGAGLSAVGDTGLAQDTPEFGDLCVNVPDDDDTLRLRVSGHASTCAPFGESR